MQTVPQLAYERVNAADVIAVIRDITSRIPAAASGKALADLRAQCLQAVQHYSSMAALAFARFTLDTRDAYYSAEKDYYDETAPEVQSEYVKFQRAFLAHPQSKDEAHIAPIVRKRYEADVRTTSDAAVPYKIEENKLVTEYTKLMAETMFVFRGETMPRSALAKYFTDPDRATRREAYEVLGKTLASIGDKLDDIYDRMVKVRTRMAKVLGYENYVALGDDLMGRISFSRRDLHAFRDGVRKHIVPAVTKLKKELCARLGIDECKLYDNDTYFACGNPQPVLDAQAMFAAGQHMYETMSEETGKFFRFMRQTDAFDVFPREGKWGGGYCTSFSDYRQPFILANFNGTSGDVDVLTHETGHAFADYEMYAQGHDTELNVGGMETAETHSMSMEFFCYPYMRDFFGDRADDYRYAHLYNAFDFLPYGTIVDCFQEEVYTRPEMTPSERKALWLRLEREFRPWLSADGIPYLEEGTRWQYQMHIYESPMYYIDYCLAQTVAMQFLFRSREDYDAAFTDYVTFLKKGGEEEFPRLVKGAHLSSPFDPSALQGIAEQATELLHAWQKDA